MLKAVLLCAILVPLWCVQRSGPSAQNVVYSGHADAVGTPSLKALVDSAGLDPSTFKFHVDKSDRRFTVRSGSRVLRTFPCVLGEVPVGDKFRQGDRKTPEGTFTFRSKRIHAKWHKFIWVDYPNAESWRRFRERQRSGEVASTADIGGEIGIHGVPDGMDHWIDMGQDWTWGCIALKNKDVDEIYPYITPARTTITIVP
ncbi:MAG: L,D-transpeptidase [Flavobacteriales bacterium]|nr:L,D-transpeptidase [Flavobacteriales bacterium]